MNKLSDQVERKFTNIELLEGWEVETDTGWEDITSVNTTIPYQVYEVKLENGLSIKCADTHILMTSKGEEVFAVDSMGFEINTKQGPSKVISVEDLGYEEKMYDLTVNSENHTYYTNDILSHNTQISVLFLLHYILFNKEKTVAILANNERTASDILRKLKDSYEQLPLWMQQGVVEGGWSKTTIKLENKCLVISGSTSSNGIRGRTINLLFLDEFAFVPNNVADEFIASVYPTISSGKSSRIIMVSTPKGMNHFFNIWSQSIRGENNFTPIKINWWEVPGRDKAWKEATIQDVGPIKWNQEFECLEKNMNLNIIDSLDKKIKLTIEDLYNELDEKRIS